MEINPPAPQIPVSNDNPYAEGAEPGEPEIMI
jgi:hypothetical protein